MLNSVKKLLSTNPMDIKIIDAPLDEVVTSINFTIESEGLKIQDQQRDEETEVIEATNSTSSCIKLWWTGEPQIIKWSVLKIDESKTRVETYFHLGKKYLRWFTIVAVQLNLITVLCNYLMNSTGDFIKSSDNIPNIFFQLHLLGYLGTVIFLISLVFFIIKGCNVNYDKVSFAKNIISSKIRTIHNSYDFPYVIPLLIIISIETVFVLYYFLNRYSNISPKLFLYASVLLFVVALPSVISIFNRSMVHRHVFILITVHLVLFFLFVYSLPTLDTLVFKSYSLDFLDSSDHIPREIKVPIITRFSVFGLITLLFSYFLIKTPTIIIRQQTMVKDYRINTATKSTFHDSLDFGHFSVLFRICTVLLWIPLALAFLWNTLIAFSLISYSLFGIEIPVLNTISEQFYTDIVLFLSLFLGSNYVVIVSKILVIVYLLPLLFILFFILQKRIRSYHLNLKELRINSDNNTLSGICKDISSNLNLETPKLVVVDNRSLNIESKYIGFPYYKKYILVTSGCFKLTPEELHGILAHELYHCKNHLLKWHILRLWSDYSLSGNGFLTIIENSYRNEIDADKFAVGWLMKNNISIDNYANALKLFWLSGSINSELGLHHKEAQDMPEDRFSRFRRIKDNANLVMEYYFGEGILSYIHPSLDERIRVIESNR